MFGDDFDRRFIRFDLKKKIAWLYRSAVWLCPLQNADFGDGFSDAWGDDVISHGLRSFRGFKTF
jgi:hypothetical protein